MPTPSSCAAKPFKPRHPHPTVILGKIRSGQKLQLKVKLGRRLLFSAGCEEVWGKKATAVEGQDERALHGSSNVSEAGEQRALSGNLRGHRGGTHGVQQTSTTEAARCHTPYTPCPHLQRLSEPTVHFLIPVSHYHSRSACDRQTLKAKAWKILKDHPAGSEDSLEQILVFDAGSSGTRLSASF